MASVLQFRPNYDLHRCELDIASRRDVSDMMLQIGECSDANDRQRMIELLLTHVVGLAYPQGYEDGRKK